MSKPGHTNNPGGRPPGRGEVARLRAELIDGHLPSIIAKLVELAKAGDVSAARVLLDRRIPTLRAQAERVSVELPAGTLTEKAEAVLAAVAAGDLAPDVGSDLMTALGAVARIGEVDELRRRVEALEFGDLA